MAEEPGGSMLLTLAGKVALAVGKALAAGLSGSSAMFAETVHSLVDCGHRILLLQGDREAERPADERHPFGRSAEVYFWSYIAAALLFGVGAGTSLWQGVIALRSPQPLTEAHWSYIVLGLGLLFEAAAWFEARRSFGRDRDATVPLRQALRRFDHPAIAALLIQQTAALAGPVAALAGIFAADRLGILWADGLASLVIAAILLAAGIELAVASRGIIIAEGGSDDLVHDLLGLAGQAEFVDGVNEVRTMQFGPADILVNLSVDARDRLTAAEVEHGVTRLEGAIKARHPEITRVFIEIQRAEDSAAAPA
jgi:cation diffusion facilitator family transporter